MAATEPVNTTASATCGDVTRATRLFGHYSVYMNIRPEDRLPVGAKNDWIIWNDLNRLHTQVSQLETNMIKLYQVIPTTPRLCLWCNANHATPSDLRDYIIERMLCPWSWSMIDNDDW